MYLKWGRLLRSREELSVSSYFRGSKHLLALSAAISLFPSSRHLPKISKDIFSVNLPEKEDRYLQPVLMIQPTVCNSHWLPLPNLDVRSEPHSCILTFSKLHHVKGMEAEEKQMVSSRVGDEHHGPAILPAQPGGILLLSLDFVFVRPFLDTTKQALSSAQHI